MAHTMNENIYKGMPRVYVACLASYNSGILYGRWIDADQDADDIAEDIATMIDGSPTEGAEEWAIHDTECLPGVGEHTDLETVAEIGQAIAAASEPDALMAWLEYDSYRTVDEFDDRYCGHFDSPADYAADYYESIGQDLGPLASYVDWELVARDMGIEGTLFIDAKGGGVYCFRDC